MPSLRKPKKRYPVPTEELQRVIDKFSLTDKDMEKMYNRFREIDEDSSGEIDIDEFAAMFGRKRDMYVEGLFTLVLGIADKYEKRSGNSDTEKRLLEDGADGADEGKTLESSVDSIFHATGSRRKTALSYEDFIRTTLTYCLFERGIIMLFTFNLFDTDHSGYLTPDEMKLLVQVIHKINPEAGQPNQYITNLSKQLLDAFDANRDGKLDYDEFCTLVKQNPRLLFPAFDLQTRMQTITMGARWYRSWMEKRAAARLKSAQLAAKARQKAVRQAEIDAEKEEKARKQAELAARVESGLSKMVGCCCCQYDALAVDKDIERMILEEEERERNMKKYGTPHAPKTNDKEVEVVPKFKLKEKRYTKRTSSRPGRFRVKTHEEKQAEWEIRRKQLDGETDQAEGLDDDAAAEVKLRSKRRRRRRRQGPASRVNKKLPDGSYYDEFGFLVEGNPGADDDTKVSSRGRKLRKHKSSAAERMLGPPPDVETGASRSVVREYRRAQRALDKAKKERAEKKLKQKAERDRRHLLKLLAAGGSHMELNAGGGDQHHGMVGTVHGESFGNAMSSSATTMSASFHRPGPKTQAERDRLFEEANAAVSVVLVLL